MLEQLPRRDPIRKISTQSVDMLADRSIEIQEIRFGQPQHHDRREDLGDGGDPESGSGRVGDLVLGTGQTDAALVDDLASLGHERDAAHLVLRPVSREELVDRGSSRIGRCTVASGYQPGSHDGQERDERAIPDERAIHEKASVSRERSRVLAGGGPADRRAGGGRIRKVRLAPGHTAASHAELQTTAR